MTPTERDAAADEYVLGLLEGAERDAFERRLETEAELRAAVARSRDRFLELDRAAPALPLDEAVWRRVARLRRGMAFAAEPLPVPANLPGAPRSGLRRHLPTALAAGIGLAFGLFLGMQALQPDPVALTVLVDAGGAPLAVVEDFGDAQARVRFVAEVAVPEGRQMQVWTLPSVEMGPVSLGLLDRPGAALLRGPDLPQPSAGQLYEITLEQLGGSPTGRPTGPIVAKGRAAAQTGI